MPGRQPAGITDAGYQPGPDDMGPTLPYYLRTAGVAVDEGRRRLEKPQQVRSPTSPILPGYNVMKYVDVDSSGDHMIDVTPQPVCTCLWPLPLLGPRRPAKRCGPDAL